MSRTEVWAERFAVSCPACRRQSCSDDDVQDGHGPVRHHVARDGMPGPDITAGGEGAR